MGADEGRKEARTKGLNFRAFTASLTRLHGEAAVKATLDAAPAEVRDAIRSGHIIASGWYPVAWYRGLYQGAQKALNLGIELPRAIGRDSTLSDFNSVFRVIVKVMSVETAVGQAHRFITLYYEGGKAETLAKRAGMVRIRFSGWVGFDRNVWEDLASSAEALTSVCGGKNVRRYLLAGGRDGSDDLDLEVRWE